MKPHFKVALCGVPGTGKTPLAKAISELYTLPLIYQGSKELRQMTGNPRGLPAFPRMNEVQRMEWQIEFIKYRLEKESQYSEYVLDACALDYMVWYRMCSWLVPFDHKSPTEQLLITAARQYDYIFYLPFYSEDVKIPHQHTEACMDEVTSELKCGLKQTNDPFYIDPFNLETADYILKGTVSLLAHSGFKVFVVQKRGVEARLEEVSDVLDKHNPEPKVIVQ